jgi:septum formation protein
LSAPRLILASASPRRQSLLREAGYEFTVHPADVDESALAGEAGLSAEQLPEYLARAKAEAVAAKFPSDVVLAADTIVALGGEVIGKAADADDARRILSRLSGSTHSVITGVVALGRTAGIALSRTVVSTVEMRPLTAGQIDAYISTRQWEGKAGAYGIQDADPFVARIDGCFTNIVGLPMTTMIELLTNAGIEPRKVAKK